MKLPFTKRPTLMLFFALLVIGILFFFRRSVPSDEESFQRSVGDATSPSTPAEIVFPVEVSVARRGDLVKRLSAAGIVRAKREVDVVSRIGGEVVQVAAYNGKFVKAGDVLVKLDDREHWIVFEHARTMLLAAQIEYKSMEADAG